MRLVFTLEALVVVGSLTARDPRSLGDVECPGFELGLSRPQVKALQQVVFDELAAAGVSRTGFVVAPRTGTPARGVAGR